jgi:hypothetical protein
MAQTPSPADSRPSAAYPLNEAQKAEICGQLARILQSPSFQGSRKCAMLLEYCVTKRLAGEVQDLKERVIGALLYGRPVDYDTSNDAIVRVKANEVRKRLAMY